MQESVEAIALKHRIEPSLLTIYVEGPTDVIFYKKCFKHLSIQHVAICDISTVDTSNLDFEIMQLDHKSNRDKVCRFVHEIQHVKNLENLYGIIDGDYNHILQTINTFQGIYITDTSCAEAYLWNNSEFIEFLNSVTNNKFASDCEIIGSSLNNIFALRLVNRQYFVEMTGNWLDKYDKSTGFDYAAYSRNIIIRAGRSREIDIATFCREIEDTIKRIPSNYVAINGHDMLDLLCHYIHIKNKKISIKDSSFLLTTLYSLNCYHEIVQWPLFRLLYDDLSAKQN